MRYKWRILQEGSLPLRPSGREERETAHACTAVLLWPENQVPMREHAIVTDPSFTEAGYDQAREELARLGVSIASVGRFFLTHHWHWDHQPRLPVDDPSVSLGELRLEGYPPGIRSIPCPGHTPDLCALTLKSLDEKNVWIVGDAILDTAWLEAWRYWWPNGYGPHEIVQTWRSVALILAAADHVVPGHGPPFAVTKELLGRLIDGFARAEHADRCPDVATLLEERLQRL